MISHIYSVNTGNITVFLKNQPHVITNEHPNYNSIKDGLTDLTEEQCEALVDIPKAITNFTDKVSVQNGVVYYNSKPLHNNMTRRLLDCIQANVPSSHLIKFLENLMNNPDFRAVNELYDFLAHQGLPITDDGHFLAYKRVSQDWLDFHSRTFDNSVGKVVEVERNTVDPDKNIDCSNGLHVGTLDYVKCFNSGGHIVVVKVNPKDAVSVPAHDSNKLRVCRYEVINEIDNQEPAVLNSTYYPVNDLEEDNEEVWNEDYDDENDEDFDDDEATDLEPTPHWIS